MSYIPSHRRTAELFSWEYVNVDARASALCDSNGVRNALVLMKRGCECRDEQKTETWMQRKHLAKVVENVRFKSELRRTMQRWIRNIREGFWIWAFEFYGSEIWNSVHFQMIQLKKGIIIQSISVLLLHQFVLGVWIVSLFHHAQRLLCWYGIWSVLRHRICHPSNLILTPISRVMSTICAKAMSLNSAKRWYSLLWRIIVLE